MGDRRGEATTLNNIGAVWKAKGELDTALDFYNQVLPLRHAVGDRGGEATTLWNIATVHEAQNNKDQAIGYIDKAIAIFQHHRSDS